ncbi:MAG: hypothetical protein KDN22_16835 [Verrucomicrobiae bacterium]|nr:hypothetical protein [Verrucomicrobiae bacterium]
MEGKLVGRYKLLERLGEGGFGVVYMAEILEPVRRRMALKMIKVGMDTPQVLARFEAERQAVALMELLHFLFGFSSGFEYVLNSRHESLPIIHKLPRPRSFDELRGGNNTE